MIRNKKHIDRVFQEKLKDLEVTPNVTVWNNIATKIEPNVSKRRAIPLWVKLSSIAAGIILLIALKDIVFSSDTTPITPNNTVVDSNTKDDQKLIKEDLNNTLQVDSSKVDPLVKDNTSTQNSINSNNSLSNKVKSKTNTLTKDKSEINNVVVANNSKPVDTKQINKQTESNKETIETFIAETNTTSVNKEKISNTEVQTNVIKDELQEINKAQNSIADVTNTETNELENNLQSVKDGDVSLENALTASLEEDNEIKEDPKENIDRWSIASNVAPVYFNTLGSGSSIHSQFNNNTKSGEVNMSYGISASYAVSDRFKIRTGINQVKLGYSTNDIVVYNNVQVNTDNPLLRNIKLNEEAEGLSFISISEFNFAQVPGVLTSQLDATIDQKFGFLEIPLELQYDVLDNKLGISLIGGVSALFLNNNEVYSVQNGKNTLLGKATNINKMSYSANLGLGLNYKISNKFNLNLEPIFKYQMNTFNNTSGNFKPYFIGVYTGLGFKF